MKKHIIWILELIAWGLIIFSISFVSIYIYNKNIRDKHTYYVFFSDVDGLIKGSPVKIQGYQVGYVSDIDIVNDDAFVTFIITDKSFEMPKKLSASVEFTGMGGSKSLELFVPKGKIDNKNYITAIEPRRINDFYIYQNHIARTIVTMTADFMKIMNKKNSERLIEFIKKPQIINDANKTLDTINASENKIINRWKNDTNNKN